MTENLPVVPSELEQLSEQAEPSAAVFPEFDRASMRVTSTMDRFLAAATVDAVYGKPIVHGDTLIIPAAEVISGAGFGTGFGGGMSAENERGGGGGGGGGGRVLSRPAAVIIASPEGVRVEPVFDITKIALGFLAAVGFILGAFFRMRRGKI